MMTSLSPCPTTGANPKPAASVPSGAAAPPAEPCDRVDTSAPQDPTDASWLDRARSLAKAVSTAGNVRTVINDTARTLGTEGSLITPAVKKITQPVALATAADTTCQGVASVRDGDVVAGTLQVAEGITQGVGASAGTAKALGLVGPAARTALGTVATAGSGISTTLEGARDVYRGIQDGDVDRAGKGGARILAGGLLVSGALCGAPALVAGGALACIGMTIYESRRALSSGVETMLDGFRAGWQVPAPLPLPMPG